MIVGYTVGTYDLFHVGHLNLLRNAKSYVDKLVVGITTDEFTLQYKNKKTVISYQDRADIVRSIRYVDAVIPVSNMDKIEDCLKLNATYLFVGSDWYGTQIWKKYELKANEYGIKIIYFPYTQRISTTKIKTELGV